MDEKEKNNSLSRFWKASPKVVLTVSILLSPISILLTITISLLIELSFSFETLPPNSVEEVGREGLSAARVVSALVIAPIVENFLCLLWVLILSSWKSEGWWHKPILIAIIAASFHAAIFGDIRPFAVLPGFFVVSSLIANVESRVLGYWSSVAHHFFINLINVFIVLFNFE